jgi:hypothetical protein
MQLPTIHSFKVIGMLPASQTKDAKPGYIILVDRHDGHRERYVTALWFDGMTEWIHGVYTSRLDEAIDSMCSRAAATSTEVRNGVFEAGRAIPGMRRQS